MKEIADIICEWERRRPQPFALATLVCSQGSSYRRPGARMLVCLDGTTAGSLSGGCLEELVARRAFDVLRTGVPSLMSFDTRLRFGCNGAIEIFVETVRESFLAEVAAHVSERRGCRAVTVFAGKEDELGSRVLSAGEEVPPAGAFVQDLQPPIQLVIFGNGPDSTPLRSFAEILGWRILEVDQASDLPGRADERTAAIVKSHNYGRDFAALQYLLQLNLRYVGLLGPRKRRDQLVNALLDAGVSIDSELFAPAGFDLGAETPEEIALAIVSEINSVFAQASGEPLRDRRAPIHGWNLVRTPAPVKLEECAPLAR
jgi:xanthine dehydrogenase accessory factor